MSVPVFVPVKDCGWWLPRFLRQLERLKGVSRAIFSYGESRDNTLLILKNWMAKTKIRTELYAEPRMNAISSALIGAIYKDFQALIDPEETHALLLDADIMKMPPELVPRLIEQKKDIIAPYVYTLYHNPPQFYDTYVFRYKGCQFHPFSIFNPGKTFELDSVGTCFLVTRECFKSVPYGDPYPHLRFCNEVRQKGFKVWADPTIKIFHLDLLRLGIYHYPLEVLRGDTVKPVNYIKKDGSVVSPSQGIEDILQTYIWEKCP